MGTVRILIWVPRDAAEARGHARQVMSALRSSRARWFDLVAVDRHDLPEGDGTLPEGFDVVVVLLPGRSESDRSSIAIDTERTMVEHALGVAVAARWARGTKRPVILAYGGDDPACGADGVPARAGIVVPSGVADGVDLRVLGPGDRAAAFGSRLLADLEDTLDGFVRELGETPERRVTRRPGAVNGPESFGGLREILDRLLDNPPAVAPSASEPAAAPVALPPTPTTVPAPHHAPSWNSRRLAAGLSLVTVVATLAAVVAVGQWRAAAAEALRAKRRVYTTTLEKLETVLDSRDRRRASDVFADAVAAHRAAYGAAAATPLELAILRSAIDRSLATCVGHEAEVTAVAFSPDGKRMATASVDGTARIWDAATGASLGALQGHRKPITSLAFSPDGRSLATGSADGTARIWNASTGGVRSILRGHTWAVTCLAYSPNGTRLVTAATDKTARVWDVASGATVAVLSGHVDRLNAVAFSPDGVLVATASADRTARIWNARCGTRTRSRASPLAPTAPASPPARPTTPRAGGAWRPVTWTPSASATTAMSPRSRSAVTARGS